MALAQVTAGSRIVTTDLNSFYNLLKGAAGETITLIYNATGAVILQPSSDPATGTEMIQIKNNAGTVQSALSSDGKFYAADGTAAVPGITFESQKTTGLYRSASGTLDVAAGGIRSAQFVANGSAVNYLILSSEVVTNGPGITAAGTDTDIDIIMVPKGAGVVRLNNAMIALGAGAAPTLGTIGGSGPAAAAQAGWVKIKTAGGTARYLPCWS